MTASTEQGQWDLLFNATRIFNAFICIGVLAVAILYFERYLGYVPCTMCVGQRIIYLAVILFAIIGIGARNKLKTFASVADYLGIGMLAVGTYVAFHHVMLQSAPPNPFAPCMPGVGYIVENLPFQEVLQSLFYGKSKCSDIQWSLLGISIPGYSLLTFGTLLVMNVFQKNRIIRNS